MRRRRAMELVGCGLLAGWPGCLGDEVVAAVTRSVTVEPGRFWSRSLPDVSGQGGSLSFVVEGGRPFDVYLFADGDAFGRYRAAVREDQTVAPAGVDRFATVAVPADGDGYVARTDEGAREPLAAAGPYTFVVDHTVVGVGAEPDDPGRALSATVELTLVRDRF